MAEIQITAMTTGNGPHIPASLGALLGERDWPGGGKTPVLKLYFGRDTVEVWPADPIRIRELSVKLARLADKLEGKV
jgi:hypothetical protein